MIGQGQINESTERWRLIQDVIRNNEITTILEIGTCTGIGSTLCILKSMSDESKFISIESNLNFFNIAQKNLVEYKERVNLIYGRIIEVEDVNNFVNNIHIDNTQRGWLKSDIDDFNSCPNVLNEIHEKIDFLLLDGGEFSTYCEWLNLKNRSKIIALDDITQLKCNAVFKELSEDKSYELICKTDEGHGFSIFKKLD
jgi:hypothetical protein